MIKLDIINFDGLRVGDIELDDSIFAVEIKQHLLWEVIRQQLANKRAGTHCSRRRSEVRGGGKKPYRQKGTGRARQGSSRAPNYVGGGKVFSPKPRDYRYTIPKKVKLAALRCALSLRAKQHQIVVVDNLDLASISTKRFASVLKMIRHQSSLVVD